MTGSFVLKVAPNYGKRYGELPKAIPCNILRYICSSLMFALIVKLFLSFQGLASPKAIPVAIPLWQINAHKSILSPHSFPLLEFELWTRKTRSRDVRHAWPALSKNP